jgi:hypothetical protein
MAHLAHAVRRSTAVCWRWRADGDRPAPEQCRGRGLVMAQGARFAVGVAGDVGHLADAALRIRAGRR